MSSALVYQWLQSDRGYVAGVALYEQYGNNTALIKLLKSGEGTYTRTRLMEAMQALAEQMDEKQVELNYNTTFAIEPQPERVELPKSFEDKIQRRKQTYKEAGNLHAQLLYIVHPKERENACLSIIALMEENAELWEQTNYFEKHGKELPIKKELVFPELDNLTPAELARFITNMRCNLSKWKSKAESTPKRKAVYEQKIVDGSVALNKAIELQNNDV